MTYAALALEWIGHDIDQQLMALSNVLGPAATRRPWVAQITGGEFPRLDRTFLKGKKDYTHSNSVGSRGVELHYLLTEGEVYEVKYNSAWQNRQRCFCTVHGGEILPLTKEDVEAWLSSDQP